MTKEYKVKLGFKLNEPTVTGKIYPKEVFIKALEDAIDKPSKLLITSNLVTDKIDLSHVVGICKGFDIDENDVTFNVTSLGMDISPLNLFPCGLGSIKNNIIRDDYKIICLSLSCNMILKPNEYFKPLPPMEFIKRNEMEI